MEISYYNDEFKTRVSYIDERMLSYNKFVTSYGQLLANIKKECSKTPNDKWSKSVIEDNYSKIRYFLNLTQKTAFAFLLHHNGNYSFYDEPTFNPSVFDSDYPDEDFTVTYVYIRGFDGKITLSEYIENVFVDGFPKIERSYYSESRLIPARNCCKFECWSHDYLCSDINGSLYSADYKRLIYSKGEIDHRVEKIEDGALSFLIRKELVIPEKITEFDVGRAMGAYDLSEVKKFIFNGALTNLVVADEKIYKMEVVEYRINNDIENVDVVDKYGKNVNINNDKYRKFVFAAPSKPNKTQNNGKIVTLTLAGAVPADTNYRWYHNTNLWKCDVHVHLDYVAAIYPVELECAVDTVMGTEIILLCRNNYEPTADLEGGGYPIIRVFESVEEVERRLLEAGWNK